MRQNKDVVYSKIADRELKLDIYSPDTDESTRTAIILLHGGAWKLGDKSMMSIFAPELVRHGFTVLAVEYRLLDHSPWPAQIEDVKTSIRWAKKNATLLKIDPDKVVVQGFSAGAHLALLAGGTQNDPEYKGKDYPDVSDAVAAVVAFFPPIEFNNQSLTPGVIEAANLLGNNPTLEEARQISPIHHVSENYPPTFLLHGTADDVVPCITSQRMFEALQGKNVAVELHLYPYHTHEFVRLPSMVASTQAEIALFLNRTVVNPDKYFEENITLNQFAAGK